ncbi:RNA elimination defective protein Red1, partial [Mortierella sp. AD094]
LVKQGLTAYGSLLDIGQPKAGETIFISPASGTVSQLVGQIAKLKGLGVIGSAGSDEKKVEYLFENLKLDTSSNFKKGNILESLHEAAPEGINIY